MEGLKITIEEWAGDNNIVVSESQITELCDAISVAIEMEQPGGYGVSTFANETINEIEKLKRDIDILKRYIQSKGYDIALSDGKISRTYMVDCGTYSASKHEYFT